MADDPHIIFAMKFAPGALEPGIMATVDRMGGKLSGVDIDRSLLASSAISQKRQADTLDRIANILTELLLKHGTPV